jgi:pilus assembly protein Flp/PilA
LNDRIARHDLASGRVGWTLAGFAGSWEHPPGWLITASRLFVREQTGATVVEYALLLALITIVCLTGLSVIGLNINSMFSTLSTTI